METRYERQIQLPQIGTDGQDCLQKACVLVCGVGGLGCPCAVYLASMGVGTIGLCDGDIISETNLNRQFLYNESHIGKKKVHIAAQQLQKQFPATKFVIHDTFLTKDNAEALLSQYTAVADCLDSWDSRLILNDACLQLNIAFVHAGVSGFCGQVATVIPGKTACLRCLQTTPHSDSVALGAAVGAIACVQATQICLLLTKNETAKGIFMLDTSAMESVLLPMEKNTDCICNREK